MTPGRFFIIYKGFFERLPLLKASLLLNSVQYHTNGQGESVVHLEINYDIVIGRIYLTHQKGGI